MRNPYGHLNPLKTEYVANLIKEVDRRVDSPDYNDEIELIHQKKYNHHACAGSRASSELVKNSRDSIYPGSEASSTYAESRASSASESWLR